jgi:hypothetical protein
MAAQHGRIAYRGGQKRHAAGSPEQPQSQTAAASASAGHVWLHVLG